MISRSSEVVIWLHDYFELLFVSLSLSDQLLGRLLLHFGHLLGQRLHHVLHSAQYLVRIGSSTGRRALAGSHSLLHGLNIVAHDLELLEDTILRIVNLARELLVALSHGLLDHSLLSLQISDLLQK